MPVQNTDVADIFYRVADLLDIQGGNPFRVRAYRNAARTVSSLSRSLSGLIEENADLTKLAGIGKDMAGKIREIIKTGKLSQLEEIGRKTPSGLSRLMKIEGIGPKRVKAVYRELGVKDIRGLREAAEKNMAGGG